MKGFFRPKFTQICCRRKFIKTYFYNNKPDRTTEPRTICCIIVYSIHNTYKKRNKLLEELGRWSGAGVGSRKSGRGAAGGVGG